MFEQRTIPIVTETHVAHNIAKNPANLIEKLFWINGRISRSSYILLTLLQIVATAVGAGAGLALLQVSESLAFALLVALGITLFWSILVVTAKRYHDFDASGWWQLLGVVPLLGWLIPIYLSLKPGTDGSNRFGDKPQSS